MIVQPRSSPRLFSSDSSLTAMDTTTEAAALAPPTADTTTTVATAAKRREPPPLNVYVRIRPFISDELERGENQKLLDIINEKHIAVKVYPTANNNIRNVPVSYNEYEVSVSLHVRSFGQVTFVGLGLADLRRELHAARTLRANPRAANQRSLHRLQLAALYIGPDEQRSVRRTTSTHILFAPLQARRTRCSARRRSPV